MPLNKVDLKVCAMERRPRVSDTMPRRGRVNEVCKEWVVHEDGALAYQLQQQEVEKHYLGNKSRNAIVREDFPMALDAQKQAEEEAMMEYHRQVRLLEERDAKLALKLAEQLKREEEENRRRLEVEDQRIAQEIQEKEVLVRALPLGDVNKVGLPLPEEGACCSSNLPAQFRCLRIEEPCGSECDESPQVSPSWPPPPPETELSYIHKLDQEKQDEELARRLQDEEENGIDMVQRDRMLAIEVQDKELAKVLQEKEKAKLRRARERAKAKALAKREVGDELPPQPPSKPRSRSDEEEVRRECETLVSPCGAIPNIAVAIDPTYPSQSPKHTLTRPATTVTTMLPPQEPPTFTPLPDYYDETEVAPPYMPVQGQRRSMERRQRDTFGKELLSKMKITRRQP